MEEFDNERSGKTIEIESQTLAQDMQSGGFILYE
jgi:hypothetical protein